MAEPAAVPHSTPLSRLSDAVNMATVAVCAALLAVMLSVSALGILLEAMHSLFLRAGWADAFGAGWLSIVYANTRPSFVRLFLPWLGMLSITVAFKQCEHVAIGALARSLPGPLFRFTRWVNFVAIALFAGALVWYGFDYAVGSTHLFIVSDDIQLSQRWTAAAVPVAGLILVIHLADGLRLLDERIDGDLVAGTGPRGDVDERNVPEAAE